MTTEIKEIRTSKQKFNLFLVLLIYACFLGIVLYLSQIYHRFAWWLGFIGSIIYPEIISLLNKKKKIL